MAASGFPLVVWGARLPDQQYVTVGSDNEAGGYAATRHLLSQGCRRIVFLGDPSAPEVGARLKGYLRALQEAGVARMPALELAVRFGGDAACDAIASLADAGGQFDGVVACSDVFAISAMRALAERDIKVPADVAVAGFDDIPFSAFTTPPLTTVRQDCHAGARLLVENLLRAIRHESATTEVIPTELVVRESSLREQHRALPSIRRRRAPAPPRGGTPRSRSG